ncbi:molybdopterin molybdotransferase MoeA [Candidatus Methylospira mobilis]|uniref:Molybdopterin molybdenumtransferase n=1 Tax=Candidatus Methylospira mobilis TaxID=1808979 RepID=A0A5Q0BD53_9GAMM|nr:gephyrin-like molybdotransferase Glp [Candidatus Methylospira mobilis]QFY41833.1 molybdopterin molybdotransferase MoeA [Candidatus Methylospira mobilis]
MTDNLHLTAPSCSDDHDPAALQADVARQRIFDAVAPQGAAGASERLNLLQALDRVLAEDIVAAIDVPPYVNSAMDGYALHAHDLPDGGMRELRIAGASFAGHPFNGVCGSGECVRIMTGAVMPSGADTVIPKEHAECVDATAIRIDGRTRAGENVRAAGEDIRRGQTVLTGGRRITSADLGLIASLGIAQVAVKRRLRVAVFSTGDELCAVGASLQPGQIHDSNRYTLHGLLTRQHCEVSDLGVVRDDPSALRGALQSAAREHDVVITSGGVSVGEADLVRQVLGELGDIAFWKVAIKPGRPLIFGHLGRAVFFGLPGNPVAVMVTFSQFVQPALQRLAGETAEPPLILRAVSGSALKKRAGRTEYQRGILTQDRDGKLVVCKTGEQGSGMLSSMSRANCFIVMPSEQTRVEPGTEVMVQPFASWM